MLDVGGFVPFSTTDWPGQLVAVVFVQGCPWRCVYCHNPQLQPRRRCAQPFDVPPGQTGAGPGDQSWQAVHEVLAARVGLLDGVVFSGGEPTLDPALPAAIAQVRALGYRVGLHTAGIAPERLQALLPGLDWVGLDVKTSLDDYADLTGASRSGRAARRSLALLLASGVAHELRTTYHPALQDDRCLLDLAAELQALGARHWVLQQWQAQPRHDQAGAAGLDACWRWPAEVVLQQLRACLPGLALR
jgi:pyruvate formate lyase activating enzyme